MGSSLHKGGHAPLAYAITTRPDMYGLAAFLDEARRIDLIRIPTTMHQRLTLVYQCSIIQNHTLGLSTISQKCIHQL